MTDHDDRLTAETNRTRTVIPVEEVDRLRRDRTTGGRARLHIPKLPPLDDGVEPPPPSQTSSDSWENIVESDEYSPEDFYTATSVGDEGSAQISLTASRQILYLVEAIVQSRRYPAIQVSQDAFRDAIAHWLWKRSDGLPQHIQEAVDKVVRDQMFLSRMEQRRRSRETVDAMLLLVEEELEKATEANDREQFDEILSDAERQRLNLRKPARDRLDDIIQRAERNRP